MTGIYDQRLVGLSVAIAIASSYAALDLAGRVRVHRARALEQQIAQRTAALREANLKLTVEMRQREQAQRELNRQTDLLVKALIERTRKATLLAKMGELLQNCSHGNEAFPVVAMLCSQALPGYSGNAFHDQCLRQNS